MFSFGHSGGTSVSVDSEQARDPPPPPTLVYFPQNDITTNARDDWVDKPPDLFKRYAAILKPADVRLPDVEALNFTVMHDVDVEDLIPDGQDGKHIPDKSWVQGLDPAARRSSVVPPHTTNSRSQPLVLSNGMKAPTRDDFDKLARELGACTEDGLRVIGRRKVKKGKIAPTITYTRDFWTKLELVSQYWDTSLDNYYEADGSAPPSPTSPRSSIRRMSWFGVEKSAHHHNNHNASQSGAPTRKYKGLRKSTGSKMPDAYRIDLIRNFVRPIVLLFHCQMPLPPVRRPPNLEIGKLLIPVTQTNVVWRVPADKNMTKRGVLEGPLVPIQVRHETQFVKDENTAVLDLARECACLLLTAEERAREGKPKRIPGAGEWFTSKPRWGGGPGGEFGDADGDSDVHPAQKRLVSIPGGMPQRLTEEENWKKLTPNQGPWESQRTYIAIGKDRSQREDTVFMISSLFHHIAIVRLDVDPDYLTYLTFGRKPPSTAPNSNWYKPKMYRSRWYDLLDSGDRLEAFRAIWGVFSHSMRVEAAQRPMSHRQRSDAHQVFDMHKKSHVPANNITPQRSHSVAF